MGRNKKNTEGLTVPKGLTSKKRCYNCRHIFKVSPCQWVEERGTCLSCEIQCLDCSLNEKDMRMKDFFKKINPLLPSSERKSNPSPAPPITSSKSTSSKSKRQRHPAADIAAVTDESNLQELNQEWDRLSQVQKETDDALGVLMTKLTPFVELKKQSLLGKKGKTRPSSTPEDFVDEQQRFLKASKFPTTSGSISVREDNIQFALKHLQDNRNDAEALVRMIEDSLGPTMNQTFVSYSLAELASIRIRSIQYSAVLVTPPTLPTPPSPQEEDKDDEKKPPAVPKPEATTPTPPSPQEEDKDDEKKPPAVPKPAATIGHDLIDTDSDDEEDHHDDNEAPDFTDVQQEYMPIAASLHPSRFQRVRSSLHHMQERHNEKKEKKKGYLKNPPS
jgi:hypothetical protein